MKALVLFILLGACLTVTSQQNEGESLFNGKDLSGWMVQCQPQDSGKTFWTVDEGTILCNSIGKKEHHHVWLVSEQVFTDFELNLKFQAYPDSPGNSGLDFRCRYDSLTEGGWMDGPQVDINPSGMFWRTGLIYDETTGVRRWIHPSLPDWNMPEEYKPEKCLFKYAKDGDGWNDLTLICKGMHIRTLVNGIVCTDWDATGTLDDAVHQKRRVGQSGHIALQLHNGDELRIRFKDIWIKKL